METRQLNIGIIGCGNVSTQYFPGLALFPFVKVVAAADVVRSRAEMRANEYGVRAMEVDEMLAEPDIDLIVNLTIPKMHARVNQSILEAGKHAYVEKPLALDFGEARRVLRLAEKVGLRVGCAPDTFLGAGVQTARRALEEGAIGEPVAATGNMVCHGPEGWHPDPDFVYQVGGGPMLDMGPYYLTALVNLLGPIRRATGSTRASFAERFIGSGPRQGARIKVEVPTHYAAVFDFMNGTVASLNMSFDVWSHNLPVIEVYGTEGTLRMPDPNGFGGKVEVRRFDEETWCEIPQRHNDAVGRGIGAADLAAGILHGRPHRASGELACHVLEAMLAVQSASESGAHVTLTSRVDKPAPLPAGLKLGQLDDFSTSR